MRGEGLDSEVTGRGSSKWQLTAALKMKKEGRQSGRGGTRDQPANGKIDKKCHILAKLRWAEGGRGRALDKQEAARERESECRSPSGEGC